MTYPATNFTEAVANTITASNQLHEVINADATTEVLVETGSVPSLRKAITDNWYFISPVAWATGTSTTTFNQLYTFTDGTWWFAPTATATNAIPMGADPYSDTNWKLSPYNGVSVVQPTQVGDGVKTTFASPVSSQVEASAFSVTLDGIDQYPDTDYVVTLDGSITFRDAGADYVVPTGISVGIIYNG